MTPVMAFLKARPDAQYMGNAIALTYCVATSKKGSNQMQGQFIVVGERFESFQSKTGPKKVRRLAMLDQSEQSLINTVDWEPSEEDAKHIPEPGKIKGKVLTLGVTNFLPGYGGRLNMTAVVLNGAGSDKPSSVR